MRSTRWLLLFALLLTAAPAAAQEVTTDPDAARLVVDDAWRGSSTRRRSASIRRRTPTWTGSPMRSSPGKTPCGPRSGKLRELFPDAVYPPIWFVAGHVGPGGITRPVGVIIAAERYADRPDDVVPITLHELAHFQQAVVQGVETYQRIYGPELTLLALALREGTAELIAELTAGRHINPAAEAYGLAHEARSFASSNSSRTASFAPSRAARSRSRAVSFRAPSRPRPT